MIQTLLTTIIFLVLILLLVGIHEGGHFLAALWMRIPVSHFSIGFGKPIVKWTGQTGIEYRLGWLPLGGYVKLKENQKKPVAIWRRLIVVIAGPLANFVLAFFAFYIMFLVGKVYIKPIINEITPQSIAAKAGLKVGDEFLKIGSHSVRGWQGVQIRLIDYLGDKGTLAVTVKTTTGKIQQHQLDLSNWKVSPYRPEILPSLGIPSWWQTQKNIHGLSDLLLEPHYNLLTAIAAAATQIDLMSMLNFYVLYKLFTGTLPLTILAGPVALYKTAEIAYQNGFVAFLEILGALSISLGLINLLPIPGLDGSHVIYLLIEKVRKKPFSPAFEALLFRLGFIIIAILLIQVITNDLVRWL